MKKYFCIFVLSVVQQAQAAILEKANPIPVEVQNSTHLAIKNYIKQDESKPKKITEALQNVKLLKRANTGKEIIITEPLPKSSPSSLKALNQTSNLSSQSTQASNSMLIEQRFDENYVPVCQELMLNGLYSHPGLMAGTSQCFYIPVENDERVKLDV